MGARHVGAQVRPQCQAQGVRGQVAGRGRIVVAEVVVVEARFGVGVLDGEAEGSGHDAG